MFLYTYFYNLFLSFHQQEELDDCFEDEDDEDDTPPTQQLELKKFVDYTLKILEHSIKRVSNDNNVDDHTQFQYYLLAFSN